MIYLGEQIDVLGWYKTNAFEWLKNRFENKETEFKAVKGKKEKTITVAKEFKLLFPEEVLLELVVSKPDKLIKLESELCDKFCNGDIVKKSEFISQAKFVFITGGYKNWFLDKKLNYELARHLDIHTCTYCNREYTFVFKNKMGGKGMVPQFDHWYAKKDHPILALSFYNLIPSCATCNAIKTATAMSTQEHLHPYIDKNISDSYNFDIWLKEIGVPEISLNALMSENQTEFQKNTATLDALNLALIYKGHSTRELKDLYDLRIKYPENYLEKLLDETFGDLDLSINEKYRFIFGTELENKDYHKRTMSKFKSDIIKKLRSLDG